MIAPGGSSPVDPPREIVALKHALRGFPELSDWVDEYPGTAARAARVMGRLRPDDIPEVLGLSIHRVIRAIRHAPAFEANLALDALDLSL